LTVYVDDMKARYRSLIMSHMIADTVDELHRMADRIGVARRWFQGDHYDIAQSKRVLAVAAGAVEITMREAGIMAGVQRRTGRLPKPDEVPELRKQLAARVRSQVTKMEEVMGSASKVVSNDRILGGTPVVQGTRVPAENVLAEVRAGKGDFDIFRSYPSLPPDGIKACLDWEKAGRPLSAARST
jgi:uncharacterized protein (DUF433 family)